MINSPLIRKLIELAIEEDLERGDITSEFLIPETHLSSAEILAKENFVFCGGFLVEEILSHIDSTVKIANLVPEGKEVAPGDILGEISGHTRSILAAERTILNFLQRLSGVATLTREFVNAGKGVEVLDTRKTTPGWRYLEKYSVACGGGVNHRANLGDMVLIKNNHIDALGGDFDKIARGLSNKRGSLKVEIEVRNGEELVNALKLEPDIVMLDNFSDDEIRSCVPTIRTSNPKTKIELSGGMTRERIKRLADLAPISVSVGALTTKAINVDISLRLKF